MDISFLVQTTACLCSRFNKLHTTQALVTISGYAVKVHKNTQKTYSRRRKKKKKKKKKSTRKHTKNGYSRRFGEKKKGKRDSLDSCEF
jgi:hypothetical protein